MISVLFLNAQTNNTLSDKSKQIDNFISAINKGGQFMGAVLVSENGKIIFKKGFGLTGTKTGEKFTPATLCYIGSLSKQFTAMGIVILEEKKEISYGQSIRQYFPELPACYQPVSILTLLHHSSGLPLFHDFSNMNETAVFNIFKTTNVFAIYARFKI